MTDRGVVTRAASPRPLRDDIVALRRKAERRYVEMDLLVAALNEHIHDLRQERDHLVRSLEETRADRDRARQQANRLSDAWFLRGHKTVRPSGYPNPYEAEAAATAAFSEDVTGKRPT